MLRFTFENNYIVDGETTERLSTMEQALDKLNEMNILVDIEHETQDGGEDYVLY